jgi:hypothetical protein
LLEPFKQTYALKEIKNVIAERLSFPKDYSRFNGISSDFDVELKKQRDMMKEL